MWVAPEPMFLRLQYVIRKDHQDILMIKGQLTGGNQPTWKRKVKLSKKPQMYKYFPWCSSGMYKTFSSLIWQWRNVNLFACPCISLPTLGKECCQDRAGHSDNDCRCNLTAEGGYSWKSVGWFTERGEGWDSVRDATPGGRVLQGQGSAITEEWSEYMAFSLSHLAESNCSRLV